ncbi:MAG: mechanosensitive ion channel family protein [Pirellulales bacterium]|nr:mechanosensitive ion channel family protein [Pirellulales bacterium]
MSMLTLIAQAETTSPSRLDRLLPVLVVLVLIPLVPLITQIVRRIWMAGLKRVPLRLERTTRRVDTLLSFIRSVAYCTLIMLLLLFAIHAIWPKFDPLAATGALSIVALILTGMFKDLVVDVVKGLDILLGGHYDLGDYVEVAGASGHVIDFQLKYTKLRTSSGEEVVLNNAKCVPSKRFPHGWVTNHISVPLKSGDQEVAARESLDLAAAELDQHVEAVQDCPTYEGMLPVPTTGGVVLRYAVNVLPGANWVLDDIYLPLIKRTLEFAKIPLAGEISYFYMNDVETFRKLFNRKLTEQEIESWLEIGKE